MKTKLLRLIAAGGVVAATMVPAAAAHADYGNPGTGSQGSNDSGNPSTGSQGAGSAGSGTLPFTGGDVTGIVLIGAGLAFGGTVLVQTNRRRTAH